MARRGSCAGASASPRRSTWSASRAGGRARGGTRAAIAGFRALRQRGDGSVRPRPRYCRATRTCFAIWRRARRRSPSKRRPTPGPCSARRRNSSPGPVQSPWPMRATRSARTGASRSGSKIALPESVAWPRSRRLRRVQRRRRWFRHGGGELRRAGEAGSSPPNPPARGRTVARLRLRIGGSLRRPQRLVASRAEVEVGSLAVSIYVRRSPVEGERVDAPGAPVDLGLHGGAKILLVDETR